MTKGHSSICHILAMFPDNLRKFIIQDEGPETNALAVVIHQLHKLFRPGIR